MTFEKRSVYVRRSVLSVCVWFVGLDYNVDDKLKYSAISVIMLLTLPAIKHLNYQLKTQEFWFLNCVMSFVLNIQLPGSVNSFFFFFVLTSKMKLSQRLRKAKSVILSRFEESRKIKFIHCTPMVITRPRIGVINNTRQDASDRRAFWRNSQCVGAKSS